MIAMYLLHATCGHSHGPQSSYLTTGLGECSTENLLLTDIYEGWHGSDIENKKFTKTNSALCICSMHGSIIIVSKNISVLLNNRKNKRKNYNYNKNYTYSL